MRNDSQRLRALEEKVEELLRREAKRDLREAAARESGSGLRRKLEILDGNLEQAAICSAMSAHRLAQLASDAPEIPACVLKRRQKL